MLHFIGAVSFGADLPRPAAMEQAARRLGGRDFGPVRSWQGPGCVLAWRMLPLRAETAAAPVPVLAGDGVLTLIGCGRIDEREALKTALGLDGPRAFSDTALMMAAFSRWGEAGADRLMGNFGFAIWDHQARRLTLARDYFGTVSMFHHRGDGFVVFGTNPAALLALGLFSRDLDPLALAADIRPSAIDQELTLYRDLRRVRRASTLVLDPAGQRGAIYWRPQRGAVLKLKDDQAYVEATRAVLAEVTRGFLRSQKPIGVMLSGGFDSGALAATLAMLAPEREIFGFTTVPVAGDPCLARGAGREWEHVLSLARMHPNLKVAAIATKSLTPFDAALRDFFADTGLPLTVTNLATRRLALAEAARAQGVGTLLTGVSGNETLSATGDAIYRELFQSGEWLGLAREIWSHARFGGKKVAKVLLSEALHDIVPRAALRLWHSLVGRRPRRVTDGSFLRPDFARGCGLEAQWQHAPTNPDVTLLRHRHDRVAVSLDLQPVYSDAYTLFYNRLGLECLGPLRDRRMIDFMLSLPARQLQRNGVHRFLARRVLADRMPAETLAERGVFETFPDQGHWVAGWWAEAARRLEDQHPAALAAATIDLPALRQLLAGGCPEPFPQWDPEQYLIGATMPNTLHLNHFLRWHQGLND